MLDSFVDLGLQAKLSSFGTGSVGELQGSWRHIPLAGGNFASGGPKRRAAKEFWRETAIGTALEAVPASGRIRRGPANGSFKMFARGNIQRRIAVFAVALLMSTIAVGAAVGPGAATAAPFSAVSYA